MYVYIQYRAWLYVCICILCVFGTTIIILWVFYICKVKIHLSILWWECKYRQALILPIQCAMFIMHWFSALGLDRKLPTYTVLETVSLSQTHSMCTLSWSTASSMPWSRCHLPLQDHMVVAEWSDMVWLATPTQVWWPFWPHDEWQVRNCCSPVPEKLGCGDKESRVSVV